MSRLPLSLFSLQAVYEEDLIHRQPGDVSTMCSMERQFSPAAHWVEEEAAYPSETQDQDREVRRDCQGTVLYEGYDLGGAHETSFMMESVQSSSKNMKGSLSTISRQQPYQVCKSITS